MFDIEAIDFEKNDGLVPVIVQDNLSQKVLMMAYASKASLEISLTTGKLTFFSRSRQRIWTKGESSGNYLQLKELLMDCDKDTLLARVTPTGTVCHTGADTCWNEDNTSSDLQFLKTLAGIIESRKNFEKFESSYISGLFRKGLNKIAQKVGEEATELIIEAKDNDEALFLNEAADLLFHFMILLSAKGYSLEQVSGILKDRHQEKTGDKG